MSKENLKSLRSKIDKIDKDLLKLIQKRAALAVSIGKIKSKISPNTSFYKPDREATILRNILKANEKGALSNEKVRTIYKELISGCFEYLNIFGKFSFSCSIKSFLIMAIVKPAGPIFF